MSTTTPQMNLILPDVTTEAGPLWATELNAALTKLDSHDHSSGLGKKVNPSGIDINADLNMQQKSLIGVDHVKLTNQAAAIAGVLNSCSVSFANGNFYITNGGGIAVQVTSGASIVSTVIVPASPLMPSGTVLDYAGITIPVGFLSCDGSVVSRTAYPDLFNALSTTYGNGDGVTTFQLPNFNGKVAVGKGTYTDSVLGSITRSIDGTMIGAAAHRLDITEMPSHTHTQDAHSHTVGNFNNSLLSTGGSGGYIQNGGTLTTSTAQPLIQPAGGLSGVTQTHNNMQPSLVINKMIKT